MSASDLSTEAKSIVEKALEDNLKVNMQTVTVYKVDSSDLEQFVYKAFNGKQWEWVAVEECGNYSSHEITVDPSELEDDEREDVDEWLFGDRKYPKTYTNRDIMNRLCELELIPAGEYVVDSSW